MSDYLISMEELTCAVVTLKLLANTLPSDDPEALILRAASVIAPRHGFVNNLVAPDPTAPLRFRVPVGAADRLMAEREAALKQRMDK